MGTNLTSFAPPGYSGPPPLYDELSRLPPSLRAVAIRAFSSPVLTSDALLTLSDMATEAAGHFAPHFAMRSHYENLAEFLAAAAPQHADAPLPGPLRAAIPTSALREAAHNLEVYGTQACAGVAELLRSMATALEPRRS